MVLKFASFYIAPTLLSSALFSCSADFPAPSGVEMTEEQIDRLVEVMPPLASDDNLSPEVLAEIDQLQRDLAVGMFRAGLVDDLGFQDDPDSRILITYVGPGEAATTDVAAWPNKSDETDDETISDKDAFEWDAFSIDTLSEYRIRIPRHILRAFGEAGERDGLNSGFLNDEPEEEMKFRHFSDGDDNRVRHGTNGTAFTSGDNAKMVDAGNCSGSLVGPKHTLTAGHCIWRWDAQNQGAWNVPTLRAGRSGSAWAASASTSSNTGFWTPSCYRSASSFPGVGACDIGVWTTHNARMGDVSGVGWFGWWWFPTDTEFQNNNSAKFNRGYPACEGEPGSDIHSPDSSICLSNNLYGDAFLCGVGEFSSADANGHNRLFRHSCDTSPAMSGSPVYQFLSGQGKVVIALITGERTGNQPRPYAGTRITQEYSDSIAWLRTTFP